MGISILATFVPNLLSCPGLAALGAVVDTFRGALGMSKIGVAVKLFEEIAGHWAVNVADVNGAGVVGDGGRDVGGDPPVATGGIAPVDKAAAPEGGAPVCLNTYVDWESTPER